MGGRFNPEIGKVYVRTNFSKDDLVSNFSAVGRVILLQSSSQPTPTISIHVKRNCSDYFYRNFNAVEEPQLRTGNLGPLRRKRKRKTSRKRHPDERIAAYV